MVDFSKLRKLKDRRAEEDARLLTIQPYRVSSEQEARDLFFQIKRNMKEDFNSTMDRGNATYLHLNNNPEDRQIKAGYYIFNSASDSFLDIRVIVSRAVDILTRT